ncbi:hypothetical protein KY363_07285 [Candidatus Woesearchaeota archaeon]|nr:hypothetical protein [Candidatus Woesearchaeota archaeon]
MPIHLNPFRLYSGRVCLNHGLAVEILRCSARFWSAYQHLLEVNGKRDSDVKDLRILMKKMDQTPKKVRKKTEEEKHIVYARVKEDFAAGSKDIETMLKNLERIVRNDETFLYRYVKELRALYLKLRSASSNHSIPDHMLYSAQDHLFGLMRHMGKVQEHAWMVSKAHSRGFVKVADISILSSRREKIRIRQQTLELDHMRNRIEELKIRTSHLRRAKTQEDIKALHARMVELLGLYHEEMTHVQHILHESDVLIHRTEVLFRAIEREVHSLGFKDLKKKVSSHAASFHRLVYRIEKMARREHIDIQHLLSRVPPPAKVN